MNHVNHLLLACVHVFDKQQAFETCSTRVVNTLSQFFSFLESVMVYDNGYFGLDVVGLTHISDISFS